jgi:hypothetical protein
MVGAMRATGWLTAGSPSLEYALDRHGRDAQEPLASLAEEEQRPLAGLAGEEQGGIGP